MYFLDSGGTNIPEKKKKKKTLEDPKFLICGVFFLLGSPNFYTNCCGEVLGELRKKEASHSKNTPRKKNKNLGGID